MAAARLRGRGPEWESQAAVLATASAHWLRHTAGSHMTDQQVDLRFVRKFWHGQPAQRRRTAIHLRATEPGDALNTRGILTHLC
ncbi:hypothetical protein D9M72_237150 [compost metagenome]